jgi:hypothetical protein
MVKLIGGWINLNEKYGDMFKGDFNPNISNKNTLKVLSLTHHCPDCKARHLSSHTTNAPPLPLKRSLTDDCYRRLHKRNAFYNSTLVSTAKVITIKYTKRIYSFL